MAMCVYMDTVCAAAHTIAKIDKISKASNRMLLLCLSGSLSVPNLPPSRAHQINGKCYISWPCVAAAAMAAVGSATHIVYIYGTNPNGTNIVMSRILYYSMPRSRNEPTTANGVLHRWCRPNSTISIRWLWIRVHGRLCANDQTKPLPYRMCAPGTDSYYIHCEL